MLAMHDRSGSEVIAGCRVKLLKDIEMERLFAGYAAALLGAPVPRDLSPGDEGHVIEVDHDDEPMALVEFNEGGKPFWRGLLRKEEIARLLGGQT